MISIISINQQMKWVSKEYLNESKHKSWNKLWSHYAINGNIWQSKDHPNQKENMHESQGGLSKSSSLISDGSRDSQEVGPMWGGGQKILWTQLAQGGGASGSESIQIMMARQEAGPR
jgi:hypothetical protein